MNSKKIFELALHLESPWTISDVKFDNGELHIYLSYTQGFYKDSKGRSSVYDHVDRSWRHLNFFQHKCYLHCSIPRIKDEQTGTVKQVEVPWAREGSGFTLLFEAFSMCLIEKEMPVNKIGDLLKEYPNRI